ncbi:hypothetical protein [Actinophytocola xanthii]|uniref:Integral membrane protein n=1 Tax=Actinophytocola xanthii TaxID=1912961 RepID=A0A1Q8CXJ9_9PSEU|nr:hypothetical protein [Actinophytocola xanthii]OLF19086.1 hypothetical protein BU204_02965 [Actinophytocola xanthii]
MLTPGPDTRVVELRVHGVMGTTPESLVSAVAAVDVAGDGVGRFVRPADRLLRPAPGPMLRAEGRSIPRVVEGYVWGGMTSGGAVKAAWALLFPFALANVAHWMLPPIPSGHRLAGRLGLLNRSLLRLAGALLTVLLVTQAAVVSLDLVAAQCLAPGSPCLAGLVPDRVREVYLVRPLIGMLPVLATIWVLYRVSCVAWEAATPANPPPTPPNARVQLPGTNLVADPDTPTLRALHLLAALGTVALLPLGGPFAVPDGWAALLWVLALALLLVGLLGVLVLDDPTGAHPRRAGRWLRVALGPWTRGVLLGLGVALVAAATAAQHPLPTALPGTDATAEAVAAALIVLVVLFGVLLVPAARIARREWRGLPRELRPWAGGWMAAPVLATAALLGGGFGAGLGVAVRRFVGFEVPKGYDSVTLLWGASAVIGMVVAVVGAAVVGYTALRLAAGRFTDGEAVVRLLHENAAGDLPVAARAWRSASWWRRHAHQVVLASAGVLCAGAAVAIGNRLTGQPLPAWTDPFSALGVLTLGVLAAALLRTVYNAARAPETGRRLGVLTDLASFWPREAHPIVPPCYAVKVAPELAARTLEHLREPGTRVVLAGDSQGSLLVCVAAARLLNSLNEPERRRIGLVTVGSQLQWAYSRAFPAVLPHAALGALAGELGTRWRSLCRGTDPLGGAVTTWDRQVYGASLLGVGFRPDGTSGPLPEAVRAPHGALVLGLDHWLPDPASAPLPGRRWTPGVQGHTNYPADPEWDRAVAMAAGLDPAEPSLPSFQSFRTPQSDP